MGREMMNCWLFVQGLYVKRKQYISDRKSLLWFVVKASITETALKANQNPFSSLYMAHLSAGPQTSKGKKSGRKRPKSKKNQFSPRSPSFQPTTSYHKYLRGNRPVFQRSAPSGPEPKKKSPINATRLDPDIILNSSQKMMKTLFTTGALLGGFYLSQKKKAECCGIIGILSSKRENIAPSLSMGVELLKNRGYDSAGIVTFTEEDGKTQATMIKRAEEPQETINCIERLVQEVSKNITKSHVGIGHTRWATCGEKVQRNAHPHYDKTKTIYIVHNGIIGGHSEIKKKYLDGVHFNSETDSEVAAQLIGKFKTEGSSTLEAIKKTENVMRETSKNPQWGIVIIDKDHAHKMWTSTNGSPILIGMNDKQFFVASEAIAFQKEADCFFVTADGQIWELDVEKIQEIKDRVEKQGRLIQISKLDKAGVMTAPPEPYKSFYSYEISQQGDIEFKPEFERVKSVAFGDYLTFIACGSSYYAALASQYYFKKLKTFKKISFYDPAELLEGDIVPKETVVLISQSGETKDLINVVESCRSIEGVKTIGIINVEGSTIARKVDFPIYIKVGREVSVAATKSMFHQMLNLIELACEVALKKQSAPKELIQSMKAELLEIPKHVKYTIDRVDSDCERVAKLIHHKQSVYLLAMRETMPIAKEAALKIKQLNYIHAEALGACEMKHGPIALIESDKPKETAVILFIFDNDTFEVCANAFDQMTSRNALVIVVTDCKEKIVKHYQVKEKAIKHAKIEKKKTIKLQKIKTLRDQEEVTKDEEEKKKIKAEVEKEEAKEIVLSDFEEKDPEKEFIFIRVPRLEHFSCLLSLIPLQILVEKISKIKGINPDMPRNLAKTVTV